VRFKSAQVTGMVVVGRSGFPILFCCVALPVIVVGELSVDIGVADGVAEILMEHAHNIKTKKMM